MSTIVRFFDNTVIVRRLKTTSGNKKAYSSTATVDGHIQELDQRARQEIGILESKAWIAWFALEDPINEGDVLVGPNGIEYTVREVVSKDYGINVHKQVIMVEKNA